MNVVLLKIINMFRLKIHLFWEKISPLGVSHYLQDFVVIRGCSHITSAKIRGSWTPPPPLVSNGQHLAYPCLCIFMFLTNMCSLLMLPFDCLNNGKHAMLGRHCDIWGKLMSASMGVHWDQAVWFFVGFADRICLIPPLCLLVVWSSFV